MGIVLAFGLHTHEVDWDWNGNVNGRLWLLADDLVLGSYSQNILILWHLSIVFRIEWLSVDRNVLLRRRICLPGVLGERCLERRLQILEELQLLTNLLDGLLLLANWLLLLRLIIIIIILINLRLLVD